MIIVSTNKYLHLTLDERRIILNGIQNGYSKTRIAQTIGKDNSTIGKEIMNHRFVAYKCKLPLECANYRHCEFSRECWSDCPNYKLFCCTRRDRSPGACNGCPNWSHCRFTKYEYNPEKAQKAYEEDLSDSRQGVNLTTKEAQEIGNIIAPLLKQGLSPYQILKAHPEIGVSERTLYNYIEDGVFKDLGGATVMNLRRQVSRRPRKKKKNQFKKREERKYLEGRAYNDYLTYIDENPEAFITQMDTVYNNEKTGPFIQTFKFVDSGIIFALFHDKKTSAEMAAGVALLEKILTPNVFRKYVHVLLTDRGSEFSAADAMETAEDGILRTRVFFCDPMQAGQKGSLESKHIELRYILPKKTDLYALGLHGQDDLNLALSHINSVPQKKLGGKSPLQLAKFLYPDLYEKLIEFGLQEVDVDNIILKPHLLKNK